MSKWLTRLLFDWVFVLLYRLFQGFLNLVDFIESFFDIFAGTAKVFYKGNSEFLINIFFGHSAVTNAFWAMALIAIVLAFGFCIVQVSRKAADVTGSVKQSVGQIMSNFFRCLLIILLLNVITVTVINITNVLLDRINYALKNAAVLNQQEADKTFSDQEYAAMTRILATVANYSVNPSADSRYNINSCFNAIRPDLLGLYVNGFFNYDYLPDANGHYTWQGALALLASAADLTTDLKLDTYYSDVANAIQTVNQELSTYRDFAPVERAHFSVPESIDTDVLIFLIAGMEASQNSMYNTGDFNDALRKGYISGEKSYNNLKQVRKDFDIWEMDYLVGYISCIVFVIIMAICIFTFIVRMFNLVLLYLTAPLFASSMPMDDGGKWQSWTQAFVIQLFSGFGMVVAMRLYLIIIPIIISNDLVFFAGNGIDNAILNRMAQLLMVLGGAWAVLQAGSVITGILAGNPGMAAIQQEGRIGGMVTSWAMRAPMAALGTAKKLAGAPVKAGQSVKGLKDRMDAHHDRKSQQMARKALRQQNKADALFDKADQKLADQKSSRSVQHAMDKASRAQRQAAGTADKLASRQAKYGQAAYQKSKRSYGGISSDSVGGSSSSSSGFSEIQASQVKPGGGGSSGPAFSDVRASRGKPASGPAPAGGKPPKSPPPGGGPAARARTSTAGMSGSTGPAVKPDARARAAAVGAAAAGAVGASRSSRSGASPSSGGGSAPRTRAGAGESDAGGSGSAGKPGSGNAAPPSGGAASVPPSGGGAAPRMRAAAPSASDVGSSTARSVSGGGSVSVPSSGGGPAPRVRAAAPSTSDIGSSTAGSVSGGGSVSTPSSGGGTSAAFSGGGSAPRARAAAPSTSDIGSSTAGSVSGGGSVSTPSSGGGTSAAFSGGGSVPRARAAAPSTSDIGSTTVGSVSGGGSVSTPSSGGGTSAAFSGGGSAPRARAAAPSTSDAGSSTARSVSGGGSVSTPSSGGGTSAAFSGGGSAPRARAAAPSTSDIGSTTVGSVSGGGSVSTPSSGGGTSAAFSGGVSAPRARAAAPSTSGTGGSMSVSGGGTAPRTRPVIPSVPAGGSVPEIQVPRQPVSSTPTGSGFSEIQVTRSRPAPPKPPASSGGAGTPPKSDSDKDGGSPPPRRR